MTNEYLRTYVSSSRRRVLHNFLSPIRYCHPMFCAYNVHPSPDCVRISSSFVRLLTYRQFISLVSAVFGLSVTFSLCLPLSLSRKFDLPSRGTSDYRDKSFIKCYLLFVFSQPVAPPADAVRFAVLGKSLAYI